MTRIYKYICADLRDRVFEEYLFLYRRLNENTQSAYSKSLAVEMMIFCSIFHAHCHQLIALEKYDFEVKVVCFAAFSLFR